MLSFFNQKDTYRQEWDDCKLILTNVSKEEKAVFVAADVVNKNSRGRIRSQN